VKVSLSFVSLSLIVFRSLSFTHWFSLTGKFFQFFERFTAGQDKYINNSAHD
jgi:hypothetical protein